MSKRKPAGVGRFRQLPDPAEIASPPETGQFLYTFTFRIPFVLGVADNYSTQIQWPVSYVNEEEATVFPEMPFVGIRIFNAEIADQKFAPANVSAALRHFYGQDGTSHETGGDNLYEQWITLETPATFLEGEQQWDPAFGFHRGLRALNLFLQGFALERGDDRIRPISSRELRPIVVVGKIGLDGAWTEVSPMLMHPDAKQRKLGSRSMASAIEELNKAIDLVMQEAPFVRPRQWRARADRRKYEGDAADSIVSFQIAAETLLYELWGLLLVEEGVPEKEVAGRRAEQHFTTLLNRELALRLGGSWDLTSLRSPVGRYWTDLYSLRNRIVHGGYQPHDGDAEKAELAFLDLDEFIDQRLQARAKKYPNVLEAKRAIEQFPND